ncbi:MAG: hypothetical protein EOO04_29395, partial [Chitinophagaceae bacterium]
MAKHSVTLPARKAGTARTVKLQSAAPLPETKASYYFKRPDVRKYLLAAFLINIFLFCAYKYCYPIPDFCSDAEGYIHVAMSDIKIYYRPFGYSRFLQLVHGLTSSHYLLTALQYFLAVSASLCCFFTVYRKLIFYEIKEGIFHLLEVGYSSRPVIHLRINIDGIIG